MPFLSQEEFKLVAKDSVVILPLEEKNGHKIQRIFYSCGKTTKVSIEDKRYIKTEIWLDNGDLYSTSFRYRDSHLTIVQRETASEVTEWIRIGNGEFEKKKYSLGKHDSKSGSQKLRRLVEENVEGGSGVSNYKMENGNPVGYCVIIINDFNHDPSRRRISSKVDVKNVTQTFEQFGFKVELIVNKSLEETREEIKKFAGHEELKSHSCFAMFILSHGHLGKVTTNNEESMRLSEIFEMFNDQMCPDLKGKPKLFFVDTCRCDNREIKKPKVSGGVEMHGVQMNGVTKQIQQLKAVFDDNASVDGSLELAPVDKWHEILVEKGQKNKKQISRPVYNDMIFSYATCSGRKSVTSNKEGSWFVDALCQTMNTYPHHEIADILRLVNENVRKRKIKTLDYKQNTEFKFCGVSRRLNFIRRV